MFSPFSLAFRILFRQSEHIRHVFIEFSKRKALSLADRSARIRHAVQFIPLSTLSLKRASLTEHSLFIHSFARSFPNVFERVLLSDFSPPAFSFRRSKENWGATKRARMWKRENEEERRLHGMQNKCLCTAALAALLFLDARYRFSIRERCTQDDSSNNVITGHCGVFLLFPSFPPSFFFSSCWSRSGISSVRGYAVRDTFTLDHP